MLCRSAVSYSPAVEAEYGINSIIEQLADFLSFIRKLTHDFRYNGTKTNRNYSISLVFMMCRLLLFKTSDDAEQFVQPEGKSSPLFEDTINRNITQKIKEMTLNATKEMSGPRCLVSPFDSFTNDTIHTASNSQLSSFRESSELFHTAIDHMPTKSNEVWRTELEMILFDHAIEQYYPDLFSLVKCTMEVIMINLRYLIFVF